MTTVYVLWHRCTDEEGKDHELMLGIYSTQEKAEQGLALLRNKPGFRDYPDGFEAQDATIDRTYMTEGFVFAWGDEEPSGEDDRRQIGTNVS
jgi:homoserine kinase type II